MTVAALLIACNFRSLTLLCFDEGYAAAQGYSIPLLDLLLMFLVVLITMIGLQAVGLILMIALLVIPAAAARFWTNRLWVMLLISGLIGGLSGFFGSDAECCVCGFAVGCGDCSDVQSVVFSEFAAGA